MLHSIKSEQFLRGDRKTIWDFMSDPKNLARITPQHMGFNVLTPSLSSMYQGQIIEYTVSPLFGIKLNWVTEITHVKDEIYFVDEQRFGPYAFWHHQHRLTEVEGGIMMHDLVHYKMPFGFLGKIANFLFVKKQLKKIFDYRHQKLEELFNR